MTQKSLNKAALSADANQPRREERREQRHTTNHSTVINCRGSLQSAVIRDISRSGAEISDAYGLYPDDEVNLRLPDRTKVSGRVVWSLGSVCGIAFDEPLIDVMERWEV